MNQMLSDPPLPTALLEQAYRDYAPRLLAWIGSKCKDNELAADLVQDTFVRAARSLKTRPQTEIRYSWLSTIAGRLLIDHFRREGCHRRVVVSWHSASDEEEASWVADGHGEHNPEHRVLIQEQLTETLKSLSTLEQRAFYLIYLGYDQDAIRSHLQALGHEAPEVKTLIHRVRQREQRRRGRAQVGSATFSREQQPKELLYV